MSPDIIAVNNLLKEDKIWNAVKHHMESYHTSQVKRTRNILIIFKIPIPIWTEEIELNFSMAGKIISRIICKTLAKMPSYI